MLSAIAKIFLEKKLVNSDWEAEMKLKGELVSLFRKYYEGEHRLKLTAEMKAMMQIADGNFDRYNDNYCAMVVDAMADRLTVDHMEVSSPQAAAPIPETDATAPKEKVVDPAQDWVDKLLKHNRFDALQLDVRESALRDGETFVMMEYNVTTKQMEFFHNDAWNGDNGVMVVMDSRKVTILAGAKVMLDGDKTLVNIYYPNETFHYSAEKGATELTLIPAPDGKKNPEPTTRDGKIPGVPIIRFGRKKNSTSELVNVIPLQDSLNRTLVSMVMSAELTAFSVMFAVGWKPPQAITPGMIYHAQLTNAEGQPVVPADEEEARRMVAMLNAFKLERIDGGSLDQLIKQAEFIINQIEKVTSTPVDLGNGGQSGEALKQLDVRLQGKIEGAQVRFGNSYEDLVKLAALQFTIFSGNNVPVMESINTQWKSAEVRNDTNILALFKLLSERGYERAALRALGKSSLANFTEDDISQMMDEKAADVAQTTVQQGGGLNGFDQFQIPATTTPMNFNAAAN